MPITVSAPNGATVDFPDGTDHATIDSVMRQHFGAPGGGHDWSDFQIVDIKKPSKAPAVTPGGGDDWSGFKPIAIGQEPEPQQAEARHDNPIGEGRASAYSAVSQIPIVGAGATKAMAALNAAVPPSLGAPQMSKAGTFGERTPKLKEAALAGTASLGKCLLDGNTRENSQPSRILQVTNPRRAMPGWTRFCVGGVR